VYALCMYALSSVFGIEMPVRSSSVLHCAFVFMCDLIQIMHASALRIDELLSAPGVGALSFVVMVLYRTGCQWFARTSASVGILY
jgi:hypothetical protein